MNCGRVTTEKLALHSVITLDHITDDLVATNSVQQNKGTYMHRQIESREGYMGKFEITPLPHPSKARIQCASARSIP